MLMNQFKSRSIFLCYFRVLLSLVFSAMKRRHKDPIAAATLSQESLAPTSKCSS